ncbi:hypothetical protein MMC32_001574 [Xylographa parallela]|nr:hypothetical protein [Xylographa parallela]
MANALAIDRMTRSPIFHTGPEIQDGSFSSGVATPRTPHPQYRPAKTVPYELREHCLIYFEEGLYWQALNLLFSLTIAGGSTPSMKPAFVPPPHHLALISTLSVHPALTTRAKTTEMLEAANLAIKYLGVVNRIVGPMSANVQDAFFFLGPGTTSRRGVISRRTTGGNVSPDKAEFEIIDIELANINSLWARAEDFWHVVGWAFNCSVVHKKRWERWRMWLEYMVGVLEDDWWMRTPGEQGDSLIVKYLNPEDQGNIGEKRIIRAIFADGSPRSLAEFKEVWSNETRERKTNTDAEAARKAPAKINIEEADYGDYLLSSEDELEDNVPALSVINPNLNPDPTTPFTDGSLLLGGSAALQLRLRLTALLILVAKELPDRFISYANLFGVYITHIRPLPLSTFSLVLSPPYLRFLQLGEQSDLVQYIASSFISTSAPRMNFDDIDQQLLEKCVLPWPANTTSIDDNAKLGACVETLLRLFNNVAGLKWTDELQHCALMGIKAREGNATHRRKRKGEAGSGAGTEGDRAWLEASGKRILGVLQMAKDNLT